MKRYLLDTNTLSYLARNPRGPINRRIKQVGMTAICTSIVAAGEVRFGLTKSSSRRLADIMENILEEVIVEPLETGTEYHYAAIRRALEREGTPIGSNDFWIAAHALALECTLVTANVGEFARVPGLRVENWLAD